MAAKNVILTLLALASFAYGQTRALFVTTNGTVQWGATLRFDGPLEFTTNGFAATTRSNLSLGLPALTNTSNAGLLSAIGGLATNGDASALTNFPALLLTTNSSEAAFPSALLRTNGDGSGLTNLPNADLSSATGILPISNGGTGATNASAARTALELGTAATNDATAFQPANTNLTALASGDGSSLTNVTVTDASTLTNFPAELLRTNGDAAGLTNFPSEFLRTNGNAAGLTNFPAELLRTNGDGSGLSNVSVDLTAVLPSYSNNAGKVLAVASGETNVEWTAISNTVTDGSLITNFPSYLLQTNGDAAGLTNFPAELLRTNGSAAGLTSFPVSLLTTNGDASGLTNFPTLNQNTTGTASNVTGVVAIANGGTGASDAANARVNLLPSYTGNENKVLALNSNATAVVWTTNSGGGGLPETPLAISNGGTGATTANGALTNFGVLGTAVVVIGGSNVTGGNTIVGSGATADDGGGSGAVAIGRESVSSNSAVAVGYRATGLGQFAVAIGYQATNTTGRGAAIGYQSRVSGDGFAAGESAVATGTDSVQLGTGTITNASSIQFLSAGAVDTNEWSALANSTTFGHYLMAAPTNGTNGQILALNSNATAVVWTNAGGGGLPETPLARSNGGTGGTNYLTALAGLGVLATSVGTPGSVVLGEGASAGIAASGNVAIGPDAKTQTTFAGTDSVALGRNATTTNADTIALGGNARAAAAQAVQIGEGTNSTATTIQFRSAGTIDTNEWSRIAALSTYPTTNISVVGTNNTNTLVFSNGILVEVQ